MQNMPILNLTAPHPSSQQLFYSWIADPPGFIETTICHSKLQMVRGIYYCRYLIVALIAFNRVPNLQPFTGELLKDEEKLAKSGGFRLNSGKVIVTR